MAPEWAPSRHGAGKGAFGLHGTGMVRLRATGQSGSRCPRQPGAHAKAIFVAIQSRHLSRPGGRAVHHNVINSGLNFARLRGPTLSCGIVITTSTHLNYIDRLEALMTSSRSIANPRAIRLRLGLNQQDFWGRIGVTQSGGSRYEGGRSMPKPVRELLKLVHVDQIDLRRISKNDLMVLAHLKKSQPALFKRLKTAAAKASKK
jgi:DNA-binding transcriptional regulator YiaG